MLIDRINVEEQHHPDQPEDDVIGRSGASFGVSDVERGKAERHNTCSQQQGCKDGAGPQPPIAPFDDTHLLAQCLTCALYLLRITNAR